tara:strand:- start:1486 stop:1692 length:207 start_codon:yes stop_codon:yes gene_type:complete
MQDRGKEIRCKCEEPLGYIGAAYVDEGRPTQVFTSSRTASLADEGRSIVCPRCKMKVPLDSQMLQGEE